MVIVLLLVLRPHVGAGCWWLLSCCWSSIRISGQEVGGYCPAAGPPAACRSRRLAVLTLLLVVFLVLLVLAIPFVVVLDGP